MPNYVTNVLKLECTDRRFDEVAEFLKGSFNIGEVDFNALIPMPEELNIESGSRGQEGLTAYIRYIDALNEGMPPEEVEELEKSLKEKLGDEEKWILGKQYFENKKNYGSTTWYDWCCKYWGTKWNAMDCEYDPKGHAFKFETAWSGVPALARLLSIRYPEISVTYSYADEAFGSNVGRYVFRNGAYEQVNVPDDDSREAYELAAEVRGVELRECGYVPTDDGTSYKYILEE